MSGANWSTVLVDHSRTNVVRSLSALLGVVLVDIVDHMVNARSFACGLGMVER